MISHKKCRNLPLRGMALAVGLRAAGHAVPRAGGQKQLFTTIAPIAKDLPPLMPYDLTSLDTVAQTAFTGDSVIAIANGSSLCLPPSHKAAPVRILPDDRAIRAKGLMPEDFARILMLGAHHMPLHKVVKGRRGHPSVFCMARCGQGRQQAGEAQPSPRAFVGQDWAPRSEIHAHRFGPPTDLPSSDSASPWA